MPAVERMVDDLGIALDREAPESNFAPEERLHWLNLAQRYVATALSIYFVRELETTATAQALDSNGGLDLSALDPKVLEGDKGIVSVKLNGGRYCTYMDDTERMENENASATYSTSAPRYYFQGTYLYVRPYSGQTVDLVYKQVPTDMAFGATEADNVDSELSESVLDVVLERALYHGLRAARNRTAAADSYAMAEKMIRKMNASYLPVRPARMEAGRHANAGRRGSYNIYTD